MKTFSAALKDGFSEVECYRVGALAVHKLPWQLIDCLWYVSHADTGMAMPGVEMLRLRDARHVAKALDAAIDWGQIRRGVKYGEVVGITPEMQNTVREARAKAIQEVGGTALDPVPSPAQARGR